MVNSRDKAGNTEEGTEELCVSQDSCFRVCRFLVIMILIIIMTLNKVILDFYNLLTGLCAVFCMHVCWGWSSGE